MSREDPRFMASHTVAAHVVRNTQWTRPVIGHSCDKFGFVEGLFFTVYVFLRTPQSVVT